MKVLLLLMIIITGCSNRLPKEQTAAPPDDHPFFNFQVMNKTYSCFEEVEITGTIIFPRELFNDGYATLKVYKINNNEIFGTHNFHFFNRKFVTVDFQNSAGFKTGDTYKMKGNIVHKKSFAGKHRYRFRLSQKPVKIKAFKIKAAASFTGITANRKNRAVLKTDNTVLKLSFIDPWPQHSIGKSVTVKGVYDSGKTTLNVTDWYFSDIDEFLGSQVHLQGRMWSHNSKWWFQYKNTKFYISHFHRLENRDKIRHGYQIAVSGKLFKEKRPSLEQISTKTCRDLIDHYVIKDASIHSLNSTKRERDRFGSLYYKTPGYSDGLIELVKEGFPVKNIWPGCNQAWFYFHRNIEIIEWIISKDSSSVRSVIKKRMSDESVDLILRYIYAGILAYWEDREGLNFLFKEAAANKKNTDCVYYVLGMYYNFGKEKKKNITVSLENFILEALKSDRTLQIESVTGSLFPRKIKLVAYLHFEYLITEFKLQKTLNFCRKRLLQTKEKQENYYLIDILIRSNDRKSQDLLAKLLQKKSNFSDYQKKKITRALLEQNHPYAIDLALQNVEENYYDLLKLESKNIYHRVSEILPKLESEDLIHAKMLLLMKSPDPVSSLLKELQKGQNRHFILYSLKDHSEKRSLRAAADILLTNPAADLNEGHSKNTYALEHGLNVIKSEGSAEAVYYLIQLLNKDISEVDTNWTNEDFRKLTAACLIEITEISFGTDYSSWKKWFTSNYPDFDIQIIRKHN